MTQLSENALNWSLIQHQHFLDGDLFPFPFEFKIIEKEWGNLLDLLKNIHIEQYNWKSLRTQIIPKSDISFRNASQLDPIDSIVFCAIIKEIGDKIESNRRSLAEKRVFSHRFNPDTYGRIFDPLFSWKAFWEQSQSKLKTFDYVVRTDIVTFYHQIYHHIIENQLRRCSVDEKYIKAIMNLLHVYRSKMSRGIPIGPHSFHLIAEVSLLPIDDYLNDKGYNYCRFMDDYHFFCKSKDDANIAIMDFVSVLSQNGFSINEAKTSILTAKSFDDYSDKYVNKTCLIQDECEMFEVIKRLCPNPYDTIATTSLTNIERDIFSKLKVDKVFDRYLQFQPINYSLLRWFIRKLMQIGISSGVEYILDNITKFLPIISEVIKYFNASHLDYTGNWNDIGNILLNLLEKPLIQKNEYMQMTILSLFSKIPKLNHIDTIINCYDKMNPSGRRKIILTAAEANSYSWLTGFKSQIGNMDPWLKRAMLYASKCIPYEERKIWLKSIRSRPDTTDLEKLIINNVMNLP